MLLTIHHSRSTNRIHVVTFTLTQESSSSNRIKVPFLSTVGIPFNLFIPHPNLPNLKIKSREREMYKIGYAGRREWGWCISKSKWKLKQSQVLKPDNGNGVVCWRLIWKSLRIRDKSSWNYGIGIGTCHLSSWPHDMTWWNEELRNQA